MEIPKELTRALASVDDARAEFTKSFPKVNAASSSSGQSDGGHENYAGYEGPAVGNDFMSWLKIGLAFSIPVIVFGLIVLVVIVSRLPAK